MAIKQLILNSEQQQPKQWYETLWGLAIITISLNVFSNYIYERGRERLRLSDESRERLRNINFLTKYEGQTVEQATKNVDTEEEKLDKMFRK